MRTAGPLAQKRSPDFCLPRLAWPEPTPQPLTPESIYPSPRLCLNFWRGVNCVLTISRPLSLSSTRFRSVLFLLATAKAILAEKCFWFSFLIQLNPYQSARPVVVIRTFLDRPSGAEYLIPLVSTQRHPTTLFVQGTLYRAEPRLSPCLLWLPTSSSIQSFGKLDGSRRLNSEGIL